MEIKVVNFEKKFEKIKDLNSYKVIAQMNNYYFKLDKMQREFIWHQHPQTDEVFMVIEGNLTIELRDKTLHLKNLEMVVIPKGVEHKPSCNKECKLLLIEPMDTINTGNVRSDLTDTKLEWI